MDIASFNLDEDLKLKISLQNHTSCMDLSIRLQLFVEGTKEKKSIKAFLHTFCVFKSKIGYIFFHSKVRTNYLIGACFRVK